MRLREAYPEEMPHLYKLGHREWPKGRTLGQYIKDNQKEEAYGTRYVLADENGRIAASLMLLRLRPYLFGIGSLVTEPGYRGQGFGTALLTECISKHPEAAFMLYSEIGTEYYERFGFQALPGALQRYSSGICMVKADGVLYNRILNEPIPDYF
ncbi:GNAT family N-acetyltransferase [Domibacillus indicus]|uniref:GNAT family N-acetyltransferase n=1 Tax=Domibacillus indicus TaxID=1437523 RepID=UPI000618286F|nr:GNAT family N-acetyltransferase [Domibacillus indicus]